MFKDSVIAEAIRRAVAIISIGIMTSIITRAFEYRNLRTIDKHRRKALEGEWRGKVIQEVGIGDYPSQYQIIFNFTVFWRYVYGTARYTLNNNVVTLNFSGGFYDEHYLKVDYRNAKKEIVQYGMVMLKLFPDATRLEGRFQGFGHLSQTLVAGKIEMKNTG